MSSIDFFVNNFPPDPRRNTLLRSKTITPSAEFVRRKKNILFPFRGDVIVITVSYISRSHLYGPRELHCTFSMNCQHSSRDHFKYNANRNLELIYGLCDYSLSRNIFVRCDKETIFDLPDKTISTIGLEIIDHMKFSYYDYDILSLRLGVRNIRELIIEYAAENSRIEVNKYNTNSGLNVVKLASKVRLD